MRNLKITIEYDGTNFVGWQRQTHGRSVQEEIEIALQKLCNEPITITGAGRTDSGVHAYGQVANFKTISTLQKEKFLYSLNCIVPEDITIKDMEEVINLLEEAKRILYRIPTQIEIEVKEHDTELSSIDSQDTQ